MSQLQYCQMLLQNILFHSAINQKYQPAISSGYYYCKLIIYTTKLLIIQYTASMNGYIPQKGEIQSKKAWVG